jgi:hypothetical protein
MRKIMALMASAALVLMLSLSLSASAAQAEKNNGKVIIKIDPNKPACETEKTTVCSNNGTGMTCRVVDTGRCKML